jgi:hypothetical protein
MFVITGIANFLDESQRDWCHKKGRRVLRQRPPLELFTQYPQGLIEVLQLELYLCDHLLIRDFIRIPEIAKREVNGPVGLGALDGPKQYLLTQFSDVSLLYNW